MNLNRKNKTFIHKKSPEERKWWVVDADGQVLGRLATKIALVLRGKDKATYTPFFDNGDFVVIINAEKIKVTGNKEDQKKYYSHSDFMGGIKEIGYRRMLKNHPERIIKFAVKGMLPKNKLNKKILKKLKVYAGAEHDHKAQKPEVLSI